MKSEQRTVNSEQRTELIENFVRQYRKPFDIIMISEMTGTDREMARAQICELVKAGRVIEMEPGIYRSTAQNQISHSLGMWQYSVEVAQQMMQKLRSKRYKNVRALGADMGVSRTYVQKYLEALASLGAVSWNGFYYVAKKNADLSRIGCDLERGALSRIRREVK